MATANKPLEKEFSTLKELASAFRKRGCTKAFLKPLALNQDNEKNQIYFGGASLLTQLMPGSLHLRGVSTSAAKRRSESGSPIIEVDLKFSWVWPVGPAAPAPNAKLIEYSQYPEVRFSGFLKGSPRAPKALRRDEQDAYGRRVLVIGISGDECFGTVVTESCNPALVNELLQLPESSIHSLLRTVDLGAGESEIDRVQLLEDLRTLIAREHHPLVLDTADSAPKATLGGSQFGGWTLEALLGIPRNGIAAPDKYGFEIKSVSGSKVSVITSEADLGFRSERGVRAFVERFGQPSTKTAGKQVFNGIHRCWAPNKQTGARLEIDHWDKGLHAPTGTGEPTVLLLSAKDELMAGWSFDHLGQHWAKKHAGAAYVQTRAIHTDDDGKADAYVFGPRVCVGLGTNVVRLLESISRGTVHLDPGDRISADGKAKARTQWRVNGNVTSALPDRLKPLYDEWSVVDLSA